MHILRPISILMLVTLLVSGCSAGRTAFSKAQKLENDGNLDAALVKYAEVSAAHPEVGGNIREAVCTHLHATTLRQGADDKWQNGAGMANHAKLVIADDAAFYIGSQNWYPAQLSELGYIVDDAATTRQLLDEYFLKMWSASSRVMANTCGL